MTRALSGQQKLTAQTIEVLTKAIAGKEAAALLALGVAFDKAVERFGAERLAAALVCDPVHS